MKNRPPGLSRSAHHLRPPRHIGQPAQHPDPGVDDVVRSRAQHLDRVVHVGDVVVDRRAGRRRERPRLLDRGGGEVQPGHRRAQPGQRQRVGADVALQVRAPQAGQVTQPRPVEGDHVGQVGRVGDVALDAVVGGRGVRGRPLVPHGPVQGKVLVHGRPRTAPASDTSRTGITARIPPGRYPSTAASTAPLGGRISTTLPATTRYCSPADASPSQQRGDQPGHPP